MKCEICDKDKEDVSYYDIKEIVRYMACLVCVRKIDSLFFTEWIKYKSQLMFIINELTNAKENKEQK